MDTASRVVGLYRAEDRAPNRSWPSAFPFRTVTGQVYTPATIPRPSSERWPPRLSRPSPGPGECRGRGEAFGIGLLDQLRGAVRTRVGSGSLKVERSGRVTAITGSSAHGQGHETTFAQVCGSSSVYLRTMSASCTGTRAQRPQGFGTFGSRSVALGGGAGPCVGRGGPEGTPHRRQAAGGCRRGRGQGSRASRSSGSSATG